jgi:hypothetical protein
MALWFVRERLARTDRETARASRWQLRGNSWSDIGGPGNVTHRNRPLASLATYVG